MTSTWIDEARADVARDPEALTRAFALAGRKVGRDPLRPGTDPTGVVHGTVDDAARAELVVALVDAVGAAEAAARLDALYRQGDAAERRGVLRGLDALEARGGVEDTGALTESGVELAQDALRTNDPSLVAAAVGPFGTRHLDQHTWRHAVLKLVFMGVSLEAVADLEARTDAELARMAADFAAERRAAGRPVPPDVDRLVPAGSTGAHQQHGTSQE
jgi:hypothetical protein